MQHGAPELRKVLFIDDDPSFLAMIGKVFGHWGNGSWEILKASKLEEAVLYLDRNQVHVIVADIYQEGVDSLSFLKTLHTQFPRVPKIVLADEPLDAARAECLKNGAQRYMQKPSTMERMETIFKAIDSIALAQIETGFRGVVCVSGLQEIIQMECLHLRSSILNFSSGRLSGQVYIDKGAIVHAEAAYFKGLMALSFLLSLKWGDFQLLPFSAPPETTMIGPWEILLMEAAQKQDEGTRFFRQMNAHSGSASMAVG